MEVIIVIQCVHCKKVSVHFLTCVSGSKKHYYNVALKMNPLFMAIGEACVHVYLCVLCAWGE